MSYWRGLAGAPWANPRLFFFLAWGGEQRIRRMTTDQTSPVGSGRIRGLQVMRVMSPDRNLVQRITRGAADAGDQCL